MINKEIILFIAESKNPAAISSRLVELMQDNACNRYLSGTCDYCNACEIVELLEDDEEEI